MARQFRNHTQETTGIEYVYHAKNTSRYSCDSKSCIECWMQNKGKELPKKCYCCGRPASEFQYDFVGAHVYKWRDLACPNNRTLYVVPTCRDCNSESPEDYFAVYENDLVTCQIAGNSQHP